MVLQYNFVKDLLLPNTVNQKDEKPHTAGLDDTAMPRIKIKITETDRLKKTQYCSNVNSPSPLSPSLSPSLSDRSKAFILDFEYFTWVAFIKFKMNLRYNTIYIYFFCTEQRMLSSCLRTDLPNGEVQLDEHALACLNEV